MSRDIALAVWVRGDRAFLQRRAMDARVLPGSWEFPGGKVESGEPWERACLREFQEEVGLEGSVVGPLASVEHAYAHGVVRLHAFRVEAQGNPLTALAWGWFTPKEMLRLPIPDANHALIEALCAVWP